MSFRGQILIVAVFVAEFIESLNEQRSKTNDEKTEAEAKATDELKEIIRDTFSEITGNPDGNKDFLAGLIFSNLKPILKAHEKVSKAQKKKCDVEITGSYWTTEMLARYVSSLFRLGSLAISHCHQD